MAVYTENGWHTNDVDVFVLKPVMSIRIKLYILVSICIVATRLFIFLLFVRHYQQETRNFIKKRFYSNWNYCLTKKITFRKLRWYKHDHLSGQRNFHVELNLSNFTSKDKVNTKMTHLTGGKTRGKLASIVTIHIAACCEL